MTTTTLEKDKSDLFNCTICLERFVQPKYLPCLHTFCEACLNIYVVSTQKGKYKPGCFPCPVCRQEVNIPDKRFPKEEWAKLMPFNHMIYSLMESSAVGNNERAKCNSCEREEENTVAEFWCVNCEECLCISCKKYHNRNKTSAKHKIKLLSEKLDISIGFQDIEEPCPVHSGEVLKVYCGDHKEMCCVICISVSHRRCEEIKTFDEMADCLKTTQESLQLGNRLRETNRRLESLMDRKQQNIDNIETQHQDIVQEATTMVWQAKSNLDICLEEFKSRFYQIHEEQSTKLVDKRERMEILRTTLLKFEKMLGAAMEHGSRKHIFVASEKIRNQLKIHSDSQSEFLVDDHDVEYDVNMHGAVKDVATMTSLSEVQVKQKPCVGLNPLEIQNEMNALPSQIKMADITDVGAEKLWDVSTDGWFTGGTFLDDGTLLCADHKLKSLSVFDMDGNLQLSCELDYAPWDVVQHPDGRIFVTDQTTKNIRIYTFCGKTFNELEAIKLQFTPDGITIVNNLIVVMVGGCIQIMTLEGYVIQDIAIWDKNTKYIATSEISGKESMFYFCENEDVICMILDGTEVKRFKLANVTAARGMALDCAGNVYVCGKASKNIIRVSEDLTSSHVFLSGIDNPFAMGFDKSGTKFFVCGWLNGALAVYNLCVDQEIDNEFTLTIWKSGFNS